MMSTAWFVGAQWVVVAALAILVVSSAVSGPGHATLALAHDSQPYLLLLAWPLLAVAIAERASLLALGASALVVYHVVLLVPRVRADRIPHWAAAAPRIEIAVANVYVDNERPAEMAEQLVSSGADVIIITEWNPRFAAAFNAAAAGSDYRYRVCDPDDASDYAVCIVARVPVGRDSGFVEVGPLRMAHASVAVGSRWLHVFGLNPTAVVDPGGYEHWRAQLEALARHAHELPHPLVLAGDFNTTRFRPQFRALLRAHLTDAHDALGRGLTSSFKLSANGVLAAGTVVRLDHALLSDDVRPLAARDLDAAGSDHLPFIMTIAVRPRRRKQTRVASAMFAGRDQRVRRVRGSVRSDRPQQESSR